MYAIIKPILNTLIGPKCKKKSSFFSFCELRISYKIISSDWWCTNNRASPSLYPQQSKKSFSPTEWRRGGLQRLTEGQWKVKSVGGIYMGLDRDLEVPLYGHEELWDQSVPMGSWNTFILWPAALVNPAEVWSCPGLLVSSPQRGTGHGRDLEGKRKRLVNNQVLDYKIWEAASL